MKNSKKLAPSKVERAIVGVMNEIFGAGWISWIEERLVLENMKTAEVEAAKMFDENTGKKKARDAARRGGGGSRDSDNDGRMSPSKLGMRDLIKALGGSTPTIHESGEEGYDVENPYQAAATPPPPLYRQVSSAAADREAILSRKLEDM